MLDKRTADLIDGQHVLLPTLREFRLFFLLMQLRGAHFKRDDQSWYGKKESCAASIDAWDGVNRVTIRNSYNLKAITFEEFCSKLGLSETERKCLSGEYHVQDLEHPRTGGATKITLTIDQFVALTRKE